MSVNKFEAFICLCIIVAPVNVVTEFPCVFLFNLFLIDGNAASMED